MKHALPSSRILLIHCRLNAKRTSHEVAVRHALMEDAQISHTSVCSLLPRPLSPFLVALDMRCLVVCSNVVYYGLFGCSWGVWKISGSCRRVDARRWTALTMQLNSREYRRHSTPSAWTRQRKCRQATRTGRVNMGVSGLCDYCSRGSICWSLLGRVLL